MKVMIDIPKEFERDLRDKFNEFFERVKCDINSSLSAQRVSMYGNYERETAEMFLSAFDNAIVITDDATTGEVIQSLFPELANSKCSVYTDKNQVVLLDYKALVDLWNAPYKKGTEE